MARTPVPPLERFEPKVDFFAPNGCWEWTGGRDSLGYGRFAFASGDSRRAYRVAYELLVGPVPDGLELDHLCSNPPCVNPDHLEPVTHAENARRGNAGRPGTKNPRLGDWHRNITHCPKGHPYDDANTYRNPSSGKRQCKTCGRAATRAWQQRQKGKDIG